MTETTASSSGQRPLRLCFVIDRLLRGGTELQLLSTIRLLDRRRIEPYLCLLDGVGDGSDALLPEDCPTLALGVRRLASAHAAGRAWKLFRFLRRHRIDAVQTYFPDSTYLAAPVAKAAGCLAFGSRRWVGHVLPRKIVWASSACNRLLLDGIFANCEAAAKAVVEQENANPRTVRVVHNGLDASRFEGVPTWRPPATAPRPVVGAVGNLRPIKGPDLLIRAVAQVAQRRPPGVLLRIAGGGEAGPSEALVEELGLRGRVELLGPVGDVPSFLASVDLAVLPSRSEALSNALLEYMAAGRPLVATDVGAAREVLADGRYGHLVAADSADALADGILAVLEDPEAAAAMAERARRRVREAFDPRVVTDRYTDEVLRCVAASRS